ncbi:MAG: hypothetical protein LAO78_00140 [Acidobacteriia bacterium]|nr:hypothetical protein [Terriglobia bacterium]
MTFTIIYVDDEEIERNKIAGAVREHNDLRDGVTLDLKLASNPDGLKEVLSRSTDLVLADVYWNMPKGVDRLGDIINAVRAWAGDHSPEQRIPIIAFTGRGPLALESCLKRRAELYDIWDKNSASAAYVTWRLSQLAIELSRLRPDSLIQRLIREMKRGASWHKFVTDMVEQYSAGMTEYDQIQRAGSAIQNIANDLKVWDDPAETMWKAMLKWEALSRAVSEYTRGHARHVINVFWLGYYLIHHPDISPWFERAWSQLTSSRIKAHEVAIQKNKNDVEVQRRLTQAKAARKIKPLESLSDAWYYASIFHDAAGCVQKYMSVRDIADGLLRDFSALVSPIPTAGDWIPHRLVKKGNQLLSEYEEPMARLLKPLWQKSVEKKKPDHGVMAALHLKQHVGSPEQQFLANEAARAMAAHNLVGELQKGVSELLSWDSEPLICLLLLCDQIQTWERERGDRTLYSSDDPDRAQLEHLEISHRNGRPEINMSINYIGPRHIDHNPQSFDLVKANLEHTIKDKPNRALGRIVRPWPFELKIKCQLNGRPISHGMEF